MVAPPICAHREIRNRRSGIDENVKRLQAIKDWDTWLAIASKIPARPGIMPTESPASMQGARRFRTLTIDGREILVGKGARENDELTFDVAGPETVGTMR